jgi:metal-responsive CopG/Arc/MetJ family transcriptional regulator
MNPYSNILLGVMRTTIGIDEDLIDELMRIEPGVSRSEAIRRAVEDYLKRKRFEQFMSLAGSGLVDLDWRKVEQEELRAIKRRGRKR